MSKMEYRYEKEDLVWEATRRSETYKSIYNKQFDEEFAKNSSTYNRKLSSLLELNFLLDPSTKIDDIKKKIKLGANPAKVHPCYGFFETWPKPAIHHVIPEFTRSGWERMRATESEESQVRLNKYLKWSDEFFDETDGRIIISIDPMAKNEDILDEVKKIKNEAIENRRVALKAQLMTKQNVEESDENDGRYPEKTYMPRDIGKYIGWLEKYDQIVEKITEIEGEENLVKDGFVVKIPEDFSFEKMVANDCPGNKFEGQKRAYRDAYKNSVEMITKAPWLLFSESRIDK